MGSAILSGVSGADPGLYGTPGDVAAEVALVRTLFDAFARRDIDGMLQHVADDCELEAPGTAERVGRREPYRGIDGLRQFFADADRVWEELTLFADDIRAAADGVVVFGHVEARHAGEVLRRRAVWLWELHDGKAVRVRVNDLGELA